MGRAALGLVVVLVDLRYEGFDLVPDWAGWLVVALALRQVAERHPALRVATALSAVAVGLSLLRWTPLFTDDSGNHGVAATIEALLTSGVVVAVCWALVDVLAAADRARARHAAAIRWLDPVTTVSGLALPAWAVSAHPGGEPAGLEAGALTPLALLLLVGALAVRAWFILLLLRSGNPLDAAPVVEQRNTAAAR